jgi:pyruvate dehydrogenase E2 component (dihydrolipoamide acetyltransferase)
MATYFAMPKLGMNMVEGTIVRWLVEEGQQVERGQIILEIETDKATQEVESPADGIIGKILRHEGQDVPCNVVMAVIIEPGEALPADIPESIAEGVAPKADVEVKVGQTEESAGLTEEGRAEPEVPGRVNISPSARKLAEELGVDIRRIPSRGRIKREDVQAAYEAMQAQTEGGLAADDTRQRMSSVRRKIAEHMDRSARSVARVGLSLEADASRLIEWREQLGAGDSKVSYNVLLVKLVATALHAFPFMNAQLEGAEIVQKGEINVGVAVDAEHGLIVPVLRQADRKDIGALQREYLALTGRALEGKSSLQDLEGGTFTITNLGGLQIEQFLPIVNVPECAILGVGAIVKKPVVIDDMIAIRPMMHLTLAFDHRLVDGAPAARFLQRLKQLVEDPPGSA